MIFAQLSLTSSTNISRPFGLLAMIWLCVFGSALMCARLTLTCAFWRESTLDSKLESTESRRDFVLDSTLDSSLDSAF